MEPKLYAVYGTLRKGYGNNRLLQDGSSEYVTTERTKPNYRMYDTGGFPAVVPGKEEITIEIWKVKDEDTMMRLDRLEGANRRNPSSGMYRAETIETSLGTADIYIWNHDTERLAHIPSGDYNER